MIPSEFKQLKDLRLVDDQGLKPEMLILLEADTESVSVLLSQLKLYILGDIENSLNPVGSPIPWPNDNIPTGYAKINDGLTFDIIKFPRTALAWPSGVIPPHKGLVIECTADGATNGDTEKGSVISHTHQAEIKKINISGSIKTSEAGAQQLKASYPTSQYHDADGGDRPIFTGSGQSGAYVSDSKLLTISSVENHTHSGSFSANDVDVTNKIKPTGISRNTVDRINYNMIVRLA